MAVFPCASKSFCLDPATPFQNFTAEAPDGRIFIGRSTGFGPQYPPLGSDFFALGCTTFCISDVSQEEADLCAGRNNMECLSFAWPDPVPGFDVFGNPVPIPRQRRLFANREQTASVQCPDGNPFTYTVPAGRYFDFNQAQADAAALSEATQKANIALLCISNLSSSQVCADAPYAASVTASGAFLNPTTTCWEILGVLPPGIQSDLNNSTTGCFTGSNRLSFFGVPTTPGIYSFAIQVTDSNGNFMVKPVTIKVIGVTTTDLPDGQPFVAYSEFIEVGGVSNPIFALESGSLPAGLVLDSASGEIHGTPIQPETKDFVVSVTEAGTGITCFSDLLEIKIPNPSDCANAPTQTLNNTPGVSFGSLALVPNSSILSLYDGFGQNISRYNVADGGLVFVTSAITDFANGRVIWSPAANEWVDMATDLGTGLEVWFTSYNKLTLAKTNQKQGTNALNASDGQPYALQCSATTGRVWACPDKQVIRSYDSVGHVIGAEVAFGVPGGGCFGSFGYNETTNRLYAAIGGANKQIRVYNGTTLALLDTFVLPVALINGCGFCPDNGLLYVAGNDGGGDGGDVVYAFNPGTHALVSTIRMNTNIWANTSLTFYPTKFQYDSVTHQFYIYASDQRGAPPASATVHVICTDSNVKVTDMPINPDPNFGTFIGDVVFGTVVNSMAPNTDTVIMCEAFNGTVREFTFP